MGETSLALGTYDCRVWDSCGNQAPWWVLLLMGVALAGFLCSAWRAEKRSGRTGTGRRWIGWRQQRGACTTAAE